MPAKHSRIQLSPEERAQLEQESSNHRRSMREKTRARILLLSDTNIPRAQGGSLRDLDIAAQLKVNPTTVSSVRARFHERGLEGALVRAHQPNRKAPKLDGAAEAHLIATACGAAPQGCSRWTLRLLRERLIEMEVVEQIGLETVRTTLKKTGLSLG